MTILPGGPQAQHQMQMQASISQMIAQTTINFMAARMQGMGANPLPDGFDKQAFARECNDLAIAMCNSIGITIEKRGNSHESN